MAHVDSASRNRSRWEPTSTNESHEDGITANQKLNQYPKVFTRSTVRSQDHQSEPVIKLSNGIPDGQWTFTGEPPKHPPTAASIQCVTHALGFVYRR